MFCQCQKALRPDGYIFQFYEGKVTSKLDEHISCKIPQIPEQ